MSITQIAILHLWILAVQVFYMYLSNKNQLKSNRYLYLIAVPIAVAFPAIISSQSMQAYNLYEYSVIFCIVFAAIVDSSIAALYNKEFLADAAGMSLTLSYFLICTITAFRGNISMAVRIVTVFLLAGAFLVLRCIKKHSAVELLKSIPVAVLSVICSWLFLRFGL